MNRTVAIVGRPNVGKSRLFNRLARKRISIVHDQPGVTRDVISAEIREGDYTLLDTGGIGYKGIDTPAALTKASEAQVDFAINTASLILFVIDGLSGLSSLDEKIATMLRRSKKNVRLVINKADFDDDKIQLDEAYRLGLGEPLRVSAEHGRGESELRQAILDGLGPIETTPEGEGVRDPEKAITVCFIGRPNVGKSSLSNRLLQSDRLIVSPVPGTTRDSVELAFEFTGRDGKKYPFRLIDTAGIKAATKLASPVEYFSRLRSIDSIKETDVVFLVLDAIEGVTQQDKAIAGEAIKEKKPIVVVVNKWDLIKDAFKQAGGFAPYKDERDYREKYEHALFEKLYFTPGAPLIYVSAVSGYEVDRMLNAAVKLHRAADTKVGTAKLNKTIAFLTERTPPAAIGGKRFRVYYATQTGTRPFRIKLFCNREEQLTEQYRRYLEAGLVDAFGLQGCPIYFDLVGKAPNEPGMSFSAIRAAQERAKNQPHTPKWRAVEESAGPSSHEIMDD
jgi:GTP-binding protein